MGMKQFKKAAKRYQKTFEKDTVKAVKKPRSNRKVDLTWAPIRPPAWNMRQGSN